MKSNKLLTKVFTLASQGLYPAQIAEALGVSKQRVAYYIKGLLKNGNLHDLRTWPKTYKVKKPLTTSDDTLTLPKKTVRSEHYRIKISIIHDNPAFQGTREVRDGFDRWMRKYVEDEFPYDVTLEKTPKSVILHCHKKEFVADRTFTSELTTYTAKLINYFYQYMKNKGVTIDISKAKITSQEMESDS